MESQIQNERKEVVSLKNHTELKNEFFSKGCIELLNEAEWRLEKKLLSNNNNYSDLLGDTDWKSTQSDYICSKITEEILTL